ncbi:VENN motif pre-toxin domain-containing protein, partial [Proteus penneri]|uniref:VENN motif pre-toxin domain-containing protein n=1 Tax=Proteus penneri TaxID=102862 RepID=UPI0034D4751F
TLGWKDIDNKADFTAEHTGGSIGTGGPIGSQLVTNAAGGLLSNANNSGHAEGTTQSAVSDGSVIVRNEDKQKQDINKLNRDTDHANDGSIKPIFDKEKEQNRLKQAQLIGEIGNQAMDIIRTEGNIVGLKAQKDPDALAVSKKQLEAAGKTPTEQTIKDQAYNNAMAQYGTGSDFQKAAQAVTGLLQGLAGNNLAGALANASSPYLATLIKQQVGEENKAANAMAHAVLGAVVAELNNQSATAGGLGAGSGELAARYIAKELFPNKDVSELTESEKQQVSALSQLASGLAGGLTTGDIAGAITGSQAGKNAVENNYLNDSEYRQKTSLELKEKQGKITEVEQQKLAELRIKDTETTQRLLDACAGGVSPECTAARKDAFETIDTYVSLTYQNPKTAQAGYQEIERLLNSTSPEAQQAYNLLESYTEAFKNFGYTNEEARTRAGMYVGSIYLLGGMSAVANSGALVKQFGKDVAKPNVTSPKGNNAGAGSNWTADKNGAFSPKDDGTVTTVGKGDGKYDGNSLPYKDTIGKIDPKNYVDILSPEAKQHILYGESPTQGGHIFPGNPGKTTFPSNWPAEKIIHEIGDITTSPTTQWYAQSGTGGLYTKAGRPARWVAWEVRDGVRMRVIFEPANGKVVTAFPDNVSNSGSLKPIKN